jgi:hypothetical protein
VAKGVVSWSRLFRAGRGLLDTPSSSSVLAASGGVGLVAVLPQCHPLALIPPTSGREDGREREAPHSSSTSPTRIASVSDSVALTKKTVRPVVFALLVFFYSRGGGLFVVRFHPSTTPPPSTTTK